MNEESLIAVDQAGQANPRGRAPCNRPKTPRIGLNAHAEAAGNYPATSEKSLCGRECTVLKSAIGVQEKQHVSGCVGRPFIHLKRTAAGCMQEPIGGSGQTASAVGAAAVAHDNLMRPVFAEQC
jgi:hypothetical protein